MRRRFGPVDTPPQGQFSVGVNRYTTKKNAENSVKKAWSRILEVRDIITENNEERPRKPEVTSNE